MFYDIGKIFNGRNDIRTNHRFRVAFKSEFCRTVISGGADSTVIVEFTEDDVRDGHAIITIEEETYINDQD